MSASQFPSSAVWVDAINRYDASHFGTTQLSTDELYRETAPLIDCLARTVEGAAWAAKLTEFRDVTRVSILPFYLGAIIHPFHSATIEFAVTAEDLQLQLHLGRCGFLSQMPNRFWTIATALVETGACRLETDCNIEYAISEKDTRRQIMTERSVIYSLIRNWVLCAEHDLSCSAGTIVLRWQRDMQFEEVVKSVSRAILLFSQLLRMFQREEKNHYRRMVKRIERQQLRPSESNV